MLPIDEIQLEQTMQADRHRLRRLAARIQQAQHDSVAHARLLAQFQQRLHESQQLFERRERERPQVELEESLPIAAKRDEIIAAIERHPVVVVCGETGSGKSTQLPKMCLQMGRGIRGMIGHTQPRRIAARSVATRLAQELRSSLGAAVGFKIRFTDQTSRQTYVKLMTDGILLAETQGDRFLDQYDTLIVDEAHERSLNIDFLLGYLKRLLPKRPDLRVIITSATIDVERFSEHFATENAPAPVISVSGRTYPVEVRYRPPPEASDEESDRQRAVLDAIDEIVQHDSHGDVLVFLPTERAILETTKALRGRAVQHGQSWELLPLYARLSTKDQNRIFESHSQRRIVLATNVAESSLTVPGIRYVVDEGTARISRYAPRSKIQRLPVEPISQASADQRKGRCGRVGPGICVRLYSEEEYTSRERYTPPEIRRSNLAAVILQAEALKLGDIEQFPFIDPPQPHLIRDGYVTLFELGAADAEGRLTPLGQKLSRLPTDPRIGRIILAGLEEGCLREILIIAAALEAQDPRERPADRQEAADKAHAEFADPQSDFLTYLWLWDFYHQLKENLSRKQLQRACRQHYLSYARLHEWLEVYRQLRQLVADHLEEGDDRANGRRRGRGNRDVSGEDDSAPRATRNQSRRERERMYGRVHRALLTGFLSNIAFKTGFNEYTGANNLKLQLWPGSAPFSQKPKWIVAAELVETNRRYARCAAGIQPSWIEPLAQHLVERAYDEPYWDGKAGQAVVYEKVSLFGLPISKRRPVPYGPVDPEQARSLFIRHGLAAGDLPATAPFIEHNQTLQRDAERLAARTRRPDLVADAFSIYGFYHKRLPADVYDWRRLSRWRRHIEQADRDRLHMTIADMTAATELPNVDDFPDYLEFDQLRLPLEYHFEPGTDRDGITLTVPKAALGQISSQRLEWLIPGMLEDKVEALIRGLPKPVRRNLIPVNEVAQKVSSSLSFGEGNFAQLVARMLSAIAEETITPELLDFSKLPPYLHMNLKVVDEEGKVLRVSRNLESLREEFDIQPTANEMPAVEGAWHRDGITQWDFGELPVQVEVPHGRLKLTAYPAVVDQQSSVSLRLVDSAEHAAALSRAGIRRLFLIASHRILKEQIAWWPDFSQLAMNAAGLIDAGELRSEMMALLADRAFLDDHPLPHSSEDFQKRFAAGIEEMAGAVQDVSRLLKPLFTHYHAARLVFEEKRSLLTVEVRTDIEEQLAELLPTHFLTTVPWQWLQHYPRYLEAVQLRLQKYFHGGISRDIQSLRELTPRWRAFQQRRAEHGRQRVFDPELTTYRWMFEELRVSLFAQQLGTSLTVSLKRLDKQWEKVG